MKMLPPSLIALVFAAIPALSYASPQPALVSDEFMHLIPRNTLFFRQVNDLQTFTQALGGFSASPITNSGDEKRPFSVGEDTFTDFNSAAQRSCDNQFQQCSQKANEDGGNKGEFSVSECDTQKEACNSAQDQATVQNFQGAAVASENIGQDPDFPDFDLICEV